MKQKEITKTNIEAFHRDMLVALETFSLAQDVHKKPFDVSAFYITLINAITCFRLELARLTEQHFSIEGHLESEKEDIKSELDSLFSVSEYWGVAGERIIASSIAYDTDPKKLFNYLSTVAEKSGDEMPPSSHADLAYEFAGFYETGELGKAETIKKSISRARKKDFISCEFNRETLMLSVSEDIVSQSLNKLPNRRGRPKKSDH